MYCKIIATELAVEVTMPRPVQKRGITPFFSAFAEKKAVSDKTGLKSSSMILIYLADDDC
jgi:hypothetical protein